MQRSCVSHEMSRQQRHIERVHLRNGRSVEHAARVHRGAATRQAKSGPSWDGSARAAFTTRFRRLNKKVGARQGDLGPNLHSHKRPRRL